MTFFFYWFFIFLRLQPTQPIKALADMALLRYPRLHEALLVRVQRHIFLTVTYRDEHWQLLCLEAQGAVSELLQHQCGHLERVLCTMPAYDAQSFRGRP
jgi:hypothetical protein